MTTKIKMADVMRTCNVCGATKPIADIKPGTYRCRVCESKRVYRSTVARHLAAAARIAALEAKVAELEGKV